jgi:hypothetical protein
LTARNTKPGVDWRAIEIGFRNGRSARDLAHEFPVSHVAIAKRARKEGWTVASVPIGDLVVETAETLPRAYKGSDARRQVVLAALAQGLSLKLAAASAGIDYETLRLWRRDDGDFGRACEAAQMRFCASLVGDIEKAARRGDWRAALSLLERHAATREDYSPPAAQRGLNAPQLTVILDIPYPKAATPEEEAFIIDGARSRLK